MRWLAEPWSSTKRCCRTPQRSGSHTTSASGCLRATWQSGFTARGPSSDLCEIGHQVTRTLAPIRCRLSRAATRRLDLCDVELAQEARSICLASRATSEGRPPVHGKSDSATPVARTRKPDLTEAGVNIVSRSSPPRVNERQAYEFGLRLRENLRGGWEDDPLELLRWASSAYWSRVASAANTLFMAPTRAM